MRYEPFTNEALRPLTRTSLENFLSVFAKDYTPTRILKSGDRTIVFWTDGTKPL